jgi:hypothetical protein
MVRRFGFYQKISVIFDVGLDLKPERDLPIRFAKKGAKRPGDHVVDLNILSVRFLILWRRSKQGEGEQIEQ